MAETMWDVLSVRDKDKAPLLGNCTVIVGDATVVFEDGVSQVPESIAARLAGDKRVRIPGFKPGAASEPMFDPSVAPAGVVEGEIDEDKQAEIAKLLAEQEAEDAAALGQPAPAGREPLTGDGQPRCQALKGDGSQCVNAVTEDHACGLSAHRSQMA